jgi:hypothetical protein
MSKKLYCDQCGQAYCISDDEIACHVDDMGAIDYDKDADHVPYGDDEVDDEIPEELFPMEDWQYDVANGDTKMGYAEWLEHNMEAHRHDMEDIDEN